LPRPRSPRESAPAFVTAKPEATALRVAEVIFTLGDGDVVKSKDGAVEEAALSFPGPTEHKGNQGSCVELSDAEKIRHETGSPRGLLAEGHGTASHDNTTCVRLARF